MKRRTNPPVAIGLMDQASISRCAPGGIAVDADTAALIRTTEPGSEVSLTRISRIDKFGRDRYDRGCRCVESGGEDPQVGASIALSVAMECTSFFYPDSGRVVGSA